MSMFSRKLEAQLRFQGILWYWHFKTRKGGPLIEARTQRRLNLMRLHV
jgi:hypothetical protein